jgi:hypothetical protein
MHCAQCGSIGVCGRCTCVGNKSDRPLTEDDFTITGTNNIEDLELEDDYEPRPNKKSFSNLRNTQVLRGGRPRFSTNGKRRR